MRHRQKIAIARIISDLIKSDTIICCEEIEAYNKLSSSSNDGISAPSHIHMTQPATARNGSEKHIHKAVIIFFLPL